MSFLKRTASAFAIAASFAGGAAVLAPALAPAAIAQDFASPEARLKAAFEMQGLPAGTVKWSSVEENGAGFVARGVYVDVTKFNLGFSTVPLGDLEVSDLQTFDKYVTVFKGRFTGINVNLADLQATGQKMSQQPGVGAQAGMGFAMMAGYIQGLGYQNLAIDIDFSQVLDIGAQTLDYEGAVDVKDAFKLGFGADMTGVSTAYLDWARQNAGKMYDASPEGQAEAQKLMSDPNSPMAGVGIAAYGFSFADQGLMPKLEPQLAPLRASMLGVNEDGSAKTEMSDADLEKAAQEMGAGMGMPAEKVEPLVRALYAFVMKPERIAIAFKADPAIKMSEISNLSNPAAGATSDVDWASRLSFEASN